MGKSEGEKMKTLRHHGNELTTEEEKQRKKKFMELEKILEFDVTCDFCNKKISAGSLYQKPMFLGLTVCDECKRKVQEHLKKAISDKKTTTVGADVKKRGLWRKLKKIFGVKK